MVNHVFADAVSRPKAGLSTDELSQINSHRDYLGGASAHAEEGPLGEPCARSLLEIANNFLAIIDRLSRQPEAEPVAWLRDLQPDAEDEALAVCNRIDPGAFAVYTSLRLDRERLARTLYRRLVLNPPADFDDASADLQNEWLQLADAIMRETR